MSEITEFLEGRGRDGAGRLIATVLAFGGGDLERRHDFIQWLFPLPEPSAAVPGSPVLTSQDIAVIRASAQAQGSLSAASALMRRFYDQSDHWLRGGDHNHLRITRIVKSLRALVGDTAADAFRDHILARVEASHAPINPVTRRYWMQA